MRSLAEIDELLSADKSLFGTPEWVEDGPVASLANAVVDSSGVIIGGFSLRLSVLVETKAQRGSATLLLDNQPLQRLSYKPDHVHVNGATYPIPQHLRLRRLPDDRSRIYRWGHNREWPMQGNMRAGEVLEQEPNSYDAALKLFLESCGISTYLPDAPHRPKLEL